MFKNHTFSLGSRLIVIKTENKFVPEKEYIFKIIFEEFLGLEYEISWCIEATNYELCFDGKSLIVEDHFFTRFEDGIGYISKENIPETVEFIKTSFAPEGDVPILFGGKNLELQNSKIICGIDIFASCFLMLTCWEEIADRVIDKHERFPATASLAYRYDFLHRPIVNEYVEMLWSMMKHLGFRAERKQRYFTPILTHDIDDPFKDFEKNGFDDPFNTFDYLMDKSEELGVKSHFYLMDRGVTDIDKRYFLSDKGIVWLIDHIKRRGHALGIHPSYATYRDSKLLKLEINNVSDVIGGKIDLSRQHYLRFEIPTTWRLLDEVGIKLDSTLGYADMDGFRCGCCYEYSVFDALERKHLRLKESPLIAMDSTYFGYLKDQTYETILKRLIYYIETIAGYNGQFVLLVHNSSFEVYKNIADMHKLYDEVAEMIKRKMVV